MALVLLVLFELLEIGIYLTDAISGRLSRNPNVLAIVAIGTSSFFLSAWALVGVRTFAVWKLVVLFLISMLFSWIGFVYVITSSH